MPATAATVPSEQVVVCKVAGEMLALPIAEVAEIIRPRAITRVPHGPASLLGVTNFRGGVLPIVSLARLLGHGGGPAQGTARIIVLDKGAPVGVLVDEILDLSTQSHERPIDLDGLLALDFGALRRKPQQRRAVVSHRAPETVATERGLVAFICFLLAGQDFALPLDQVIEVALFPSDIAEVPRTDQAMLGVGTLRNTLVPLVSLHVLLGASQRCRR